MIRPAMSRGVRAVSSLWVTVVIVTLSTSPGLSPAEANTTVGGLTSADGGKHGDGSSFGGADVAHGDGPRRRLTQISKDRP